VRHYARGARRDTWRAARIRAIWDLEHHAELSLYSRRATLHEATTWVNGRHRTLLVTHGKTSAARRVLPMTPRVRMILDGLWERSGKPVEGWIWAAAGAAAATSRRRA